LARVLYVTRTPFDQPNQGERLRYWSIATTLRKLGHEVTGYWIEDEEGLEISSDVELEDIGELKNIRRSIRYTSAYHWNRLLPWIRSEKFDLAIITHPVASDLVLALKKLRIYTIIDSHNFELNWQMLWSLERKWLDQLTLAFGERMYLTKADRVWVVSEQDAVSYRRAHGLKSVFVVPNVVDIPVLKEADTAPEVLFVGSFRYRPNLEAARFLVSKVAPVLFKRMPEVKIVLVGRKTPSWFYNIKSPNVVVAGEVDNLGQYYATAGVVVAPLFHGGGTKFKVVEAMAYGKAIIASVNAVKGLHVNESVVAVAKLQGEEFTAAIVDMLKDSARRRELGLAARTEAVTKYSMEILKKKIHDEMCLANMENLL